METPNVMYWNMDEAVRTQQLDYAEQALAFTVQGLANKREPPAVMLKAGFADFDWPLADPWWRKELESTQRVRFIDLRTPTLCDLVVNAVPRNTKAVLYENADPTGVGYTLAPALTLAGLESLLPVTTQMMSAHPCLANLSIAHDLRVEIMPQMRSRDSAWRWAIDELLPRASRDRIFNLYHYTASSR